MRTFFVLAMPRSGTAWLANFLTWGDAHCFHESSFGCESLGDLEHAFRRTERSVVGSCDTAAIMFYRPLQTRFPESKFLFIVRDKEEVRASLNKAGFETTGVDMMGDMLSEAIRDTNLHSAAVPFHSLFSQCGMREIWDWLEIPGAFPWQRFEMLREMNVQDHARRDPHTPRADLKIQDNMARFSRLMASVYPPKPAGYGPLVSQV